MLIHQTLSCQPMVSQRKRGGEIAVLPRKTMVMLCITFINFHHLGKSGSLVVCISPFSTIMMDQKVKLSALGWDVEMVGESKTDKAAFDRVINGEVQLVYISPENIINKSVYRKMLLTHIQGEFGWSCSRRSPLC